jgi:class 3 adenylate cyclase
MERKDYRLAAILYTDIAGFSKMMEKNETRTLELLHTHNTLIEEIVTRRGGTVIKTIGDAFLIDFKNTVDALQSAVEIQYKLYEYNKENTDLPLLVRIGLHLGDIYFYENDALGEGINIAARLQSIAHPGCICMSGDVYNLVLNKVDFAAEKLGRVSLKNITKEVHAYEIVTPNVEFDPNREARPILRPDKEEKIIAAPLSEPKNGEMTGTASTASAPASVQSAPADAPDAAADVAKAADIKRRIMLDIKAAGRRLAVDQMLVRYGSEGKVALSVIEDLASKGILLRETASGGSGDRDAGAGFGGREGGRPGDDFSRGPRADGRIKDDLVHAVTDIEYRIEEEVRRGLDAAFARRHGTQTAHEAARMARREYRAEWRTYRDRVRGREDEEKNPSGEGNWDAKVDKSYFRSAADGVSEFESYSLKVRNEARTARAGFIGHLIPFIAVNAFLMALNANVSPGFPWALFPFGGWGIGLLEHFAAVLRRGDRAAELAKMPPLDAERLSLFKRLQKKKDAFWLHAAQTFTTSTFLFMINAITSPQFWWFAIPAAGMGIGLLSHGAAYAAKKAELEGSILEGLGLKGSWNSALAQMPSSLQEDSADLGPYRDLVEAAKATRAAIVAQVNAGGRKKAKRGSSTQETPVGDDLLPALDSYVEQVALLAKRTNEVDRIIELIPMDALRTDKENLQRKIEGKSGEGLRKEYEKSLAEIERQETSFNELKEQREVLELRMRSSVNTLKQMRIDLARLAGMADQDETASARAVREKTVELNRYLDDLRAGYAELDRIEARTLPSTEEKV